MTKNNLSNPIIEIVHAALIWITLYAAEIIAVYLLNFAPATKEYYFATIGMSGFLALAVPFLGSKPIVSDIQDICVYDTALQIGGLILYTKGVTSTFETMGAQFILILKMARVTWPLFSQHLDLPPSWPPFGIIGFIKKFWRGTKAISLPQYQVRKFYRIFPFLFLLSILLHFAYTKTGAPIKAIITFLVLLWGSKLLIAKLENQDQHYKEALHSLGVAEGEALASAKMIAELTAKNAELQALYNERDALAQKLAAHNDRLGDSTHDLKHALAPLHFKANDILASALTDEQRAAASWMKAELATVADKMVKIIAEAQITTPLPAKTKLAISVPDLCDYFFTRFNPLALECDVTLKCRYGTTPFAIQCNEELLKRILTNLLSNAITYAQANADVRLRFFRTRNECWIRVIDTGPGIPGIDGRDEAANFVTLLDKVAEAKLAAATRQSEIDTDSVRGNGVGLHSVYRLCREAGITMKLRSRPGHGTVFHFKVPATD